MKRDMDLIRDLLIRIEGSPHKPSWKELAATNDDVETERILNHLELIEDAGFTKSTVVRMQRFRLPHDIELTWEGHGFLGDVREPDIWRKTKERAKGVAGVGLAFVWEIAKAEIRLKLGLP